MDRTKALHGPQTQAYGETKYKKYLSQVLDRTKPLHGPRTQAYGETKYKKEISHKFWTEPRPCMVFGLKPMGKPSTLKDLKFWTEPRPCMVLGLKPMGKPSTKKDLSQVLDRTKALHGPRTQAYGETKYIKKILSFGQNQGLAWSSDSSLWGNQVH